LERSWERRDAVGSCPGETESGFHAGISLTCSAFAGGKGPEFAGSETWSSWHSWDWRVGYGSEGIRWFEQRPNAPLRRVSNVTTEWQAMSELTHQRRQLGRTTPMSNVKWFAMRAQLAVSRRVVHAGFQTGQNRKYVCLLGSRMSRQGPTTQASNTKGKQTFQTGGDEFQS